VFLIVQNRNLWITCEVDSVLLACWELSSQSVVAQMKWGSGAY